MITINKGSTGIDKGTRRALDLNNYSPASTPVSTAGSSASNFDRSFLMSVIGEKNRSPLVACSDSDRMSPWDGNIQIISADLTIQDRIQQERKRARASRHAQGRCTRSISTVVRLRNEIASLRGEISNLDSEIRKVAERCGDDMSCGHGSPP